MLRGKRAHSRDQIQWPGEEEDQELELQLELDWTLDYPIPSLELSQELLTSEKPAVTQAGPPSRAAVNGTEWELRPSVVTTTLYTTTTIEKFESLAKRRLRRNTARTGTLHRHQCRRRHSLWDLRYGHLPRFLHFFVIQNWFKKLFPIFTMEVRGDAWEAGWEDRGDGGGVVQGQGLSSLSLQAYPEVGTVNGLALRLMDLLKEASWEDRVHILRALLRLLPEMSRNLYKKLPGILKYLLNLDQPPNLQVRPCPAPAHPAPPCHAPGWPQNHPPVSGKDPEAVCDAGSAAATGLLPGFARGGAGAHVLPPLLPSLLQVRPPCPLPTLLASRGGRQELGDGDEPPSPVTGLSSRSCWTGWASRIRRASCSGR